MTAPVRLAVPQPWDEVVSRAGGLEGRCLVTDAGDGWTLLDLDSTASDLVVDQFAGTLYELDQEGDVWRLQPGELPEPLANYVDDPGDPDEVAAFDAAWAAVPAALVEADPRLRPPHAVQLVLAPSLAERDLAACALGLATDLVAVSEGSWILVSTALAPDAEDASEPVHLVAAAAGLTANSGSALVLTAGADLAEVLLVRRGRVLSRHVWNLQRALVGTGVGVDDGWTGLGPPDAIAEDLVAAIDPVARDDVTLVRALLRRQGAPVTLLAELAALVAPGVDTELVDSVLEGRRTLEDDARSRLVRAPDSFHQFLRSSWKAPAPLEVGRIPWYAIICTLLMPVGLVVWPLRIMQLVDGSIDWWGAAQLVGWTVSLPFTVWQAARLRRWWAERRHSIPA